VQFGQEVHAKMLEKREQAYCSGFVKAMRPMITQRTQRLFHGRSSAQHVTHILHHAFLCFAMGLPGTSDGLIPLVCVGFFKSVTACGVVWLWLHRYRAVQQKNCCPCATALSTRAIGAAVAVRLASLRTQRGGRERYQRCSGSNWDKHETGSCRMRALQRKKKRVVVTNESVQFFLQRCVDETHPRLKTGPLPSCS
jgi:hypothetical protein